MTVLLGLALRGDAARLTIVRRDGRRVGSMKEPLDGWVGEWWQTHPDERYRAVLSLLERASLEGLIPAGGVAGIGLACEPGLVLLDPEHHPVPPRSLPWTEVRGERNDPPIESLKTLLALDPRRARNIGTVLSTLDYIRFRLTGSLATHRSWAWQSGLVRGPDSVESWDAQRVEASGIPLRALPPIFTAQCRVGVVSEEVVERTGIHGGVWVNAGTDPLSASLWLADEPALATRIAVRSADHADLWETVAEPAPDRAELASPIEHPVWYRRRESWSGLVGTRPLPEEWLEDGRVVLDFRGDLNETERWPLTIEGDLWVAYDAGGPSAGAAVLAGIGLGWWRDVRTLWRKKRPPIRYHDWRERKQQELDERESAGIAGGEEERQG